jgi:xylan 1,4-beta-xylosidase
MMMEKLDLGRRDVLKAGGLITAAAALPAFAATGLRTLPVRIDTRRVTGPLTHIWEECVGSDRAAMTLRESWRNDLQRWKNEVGVKRVRFHGIFLDEMGVYAPTILSGGKTKYNFQRVDQVYDGLLDRGVRPFVELSFMPKALATGKPGVFFYGMNVTPPKSNEGWADLVKTFAAHLIDRYGINEVKDWPFEVWNEPNLGTFWEGTKQQYFDMYKASAVALKSLDRRIQVGGPSTASGEWLTEFANYCTQNNAPVDFFTTHIYAGDDQSHLFGKDAPRISQNDVIPRVIERTRREIDAAGHAGKPLWITEWSSDSPAMIAHVITNCLPFCQGMSQWALSAEFEELGIPDFILKEGDTGWGMMAAGIAKPSFNTYKLMRALGDERLAAEGPVLASRSARSVSALVWNLAEAKQPSGIPGMAHTRTVSGEAKRLELEFLGARPGQRVQVRYVDQERGSPMPAWRAMGSPQYPRREQLEALRKAADVPAPQTLRLGADRKLILDLPPEGVALVEFAR